MKTAYSREQVCAIEQNLSDGFLSPGGLKSFDWMLGGERVAEKSVLDFGCGTGGPACHLITHFQARKVVGVDPGAYQVQTSTARARDLGLHDKASFRLIQDETQPFSDNCFDIVFSKDVIVHVPDKQKLFKEFFRVLVPGGRLIISDHLFVGAHDEREAFRQCLSYARMIATPANLPEMTEAIEQAGFEAISAIDRTSNYMDERDEGQDGDRMADVRHILGAKAAGDWPKFLESYRLLMAKGQVAFVHFYANKPQ